MVALSGTWDKLFDRICCRSGLTNDADIVVGLPFLSSTNNLRFWITLCDAWRVEGTESLLQQFQQADGNGKLGMKEFCTTWNANLITKVLGVQFCTWRKMNLLALRPAYRTVPTSCRFSRSMTPESGRRSRHCRASLGCTSCLFPRLLVLWPLSCCVKALTKFVGSEAG